MSEEGSQVDRLGKTVGKKVKKNESFAKEKKKSITLRIPSDAVLLASFILYLAKVQ